MEEFLIVSAARVLQNEPPEDVTMRSDELGGLAFVVEPVPGAKCPRCWHVETTIGEDPAHPEICGRCARAVAAR